MSTKKYKIVYGYNESDYLPINENELPKAIAMYIEGNGRGIFENGAIRAQDIMRIVPDWHADQGWNRGWKMQPADFDAIKHLERPYKETYEQAKTIAHIALKENKRELLNQPLSESIKLLPESFTKELVEKMRI